MSQSNRLAKLEAQAFANTAKIQELSSTNAQLTTHNRQQNELITRFETVSAISPSISPSLWARPGIPQLPKPPTPFHIAARTAPNLKLSFVVPGMNGETLELEAALLDLAFVLERTLKRRGWGEQMTKQGVLDFLEVPLVKVEWRGEEGEIGMLVKP